MNNHGVFRSYDQGQSWRHFAAAFRDDTFPQQIVNVGPRVIDHADHGLLVFGNWFGSAAAPTKSERLVVLQSVDGGEHWTGASCDVGFQRYEPPVLVHDGKFLFVTRNQTTACDHRQMTRVPSQSPEIIETNLIDPRNVDTLDLSLKLSAWIVREDRCRYHQT